MYGKMAFLALCIGSVCLCAPTEDTLTVLLLGDGAALAAGAPEGVSQIEWVEDFLAESFAGKVKVINAGAPGATVREGRDALASYRGVAPDAVVAWFGMHDCLNLSPAEFLAQYEGLVADVERLFSGCPLLLATSTPFTDRHPLARDERFEEAGGLDAYLAKHYVATVRELAQRKQLTVIDHHRSFTAALAHAESGDALIGPDGAQLTARGNLLAGRAVAQAILTALGRVDTTPSRTPHRSRSIEPHEPGQTPLLDLWDKYLADAWLRDLRHAGPEERIFLVRQLPMEAASDESMTAAMGAAVAVLKDAFVHSNRKHSIAGWLQHTARERAIPAILAYLREDPLEPYVRSEIIPLLNSISGKTPAARAASALALTEEDIEILIRILHIADARASDATIALILAAGPPGLSRLLQLIRSSPEPPAVQWFDRLIRQLGNNRPEPFQRFLIEEARNAERPFLAHKCLEFLMKMTRNSQDLPLELLVEVCATDRDGQRLLSAMRLLDHGADALPALRAWLWGDDRELAFLAVFLLLELRATLENREEAQQALSLIHEYYAQNDAREILMTLAHISGWIADQSTPVRRQEIVRHLQTTHEPARYFTSPQRYEWSNWWRPNGPWRLQFFVPLLERFLAEGTENERTIAEELMFVLWQYARSERAAAASPPTRARAAAELREQEQLVKRLDTAARECLAAGDMAGFKRRLRQAEAAGLKADRLNWYAWQLAACADAARRDPVEAEQIAGRAIAMGGRTAQHLDTLAAALAAQERYEDALNLQIEALQLLGQSQDAGAFAARLILYRMGRPFVFASPAE